MPDPRAPADVARDLETVVIEAHAMAATAPFGGSLREWYANLSQLAQEAVALLRADPVPSPGECVWTIDDVGGDSIHETSCGKQFASDDGSADGLSFCCFCGKPLREVLASEAPVDPGALSLEPAEPRE